MKLVKHFLENSRYFAQFTPSQEVNYYLLAYSVTLNYVLQIAWLADLITSRANNDIHALQFSSVSRSTRPDLQQFHTVILIQIQGLA
jgi:hypothetical protein